MCTWEAIITVLQEKTYMYTCCTYMVMSCTEAKPGASAADLDRVIYSSSPLLIRYKLQWTYMYHQPVFIYYVEG